MVQQVIDNVRVLMQRFAMSRPLGEQYMDYLPFTIMVVLGQASGDRVSCLLVAPAGPLSSIPVDLEGTTVNPGVLQFSGTYEDLQEKLRLLRNLGYVLVMYRYNAIEGWVSTLDAVAPSNNVVVDPYSLVELSKLLPRTHIYCELFGGSAPLLCSRAPSPVEVINDRGSFVVDFMQMLRTTDSFNLLVLLSRIFPFSVQLDPDSLRRFVHTTPRNDPDVVRGFSWYRLVRESYRRAWPTIGPEATQVLISDSNLVHELETLDPYLPSLHGRLMRVQYENNQYNKILASFDSANTLFWVDVPLSAGQDDNTEEVVAALQQLEHLTGHVALYWRPNCSNFVLTRLVHEGMFSTWQQHQLTDAVVYTKPVS